MTILTWKMAHRLICDRGLRITKARDYEDNRLKELIEELNNLNQREDEIIFEIISKGSDDSTQENKTTQDSTKENTI